MQQNQKLDYQLNYIPYRYRHRSNNGKRFGLISYYKQKQYSIHKKKYSNPQHKIQYRKTGQIEDEAKMKQQVQRQAKKVTQSIWQILNYKRYNDNNSEKCHHGSPIQQNKYGQIEINQSAKDKKQQFLIQFEKDIFIPNKRAFQNIEERQQNSVQNLQKSQIFNNQDLQQMRAILISNISLDRVNKTQQQIHLISLNEQKNTVFHNTMKESNEIEFKNNIQQCINDQEDVNLDYAYEKSTIKKNNSKNKLMMKQNIQQIVVVSKGLSVKQDKSYSQSSQKSKKQSSKGENLYILKQQGYNKIHGPSKIKKKAIKIQHFIENKKLYLSSSQSIKSSNNDYQQNNMMESNLQLNEQKRSNSKLSQQLLQDNQSHQDELTKDYQQNYQQPQILKENSHQISNNGNNIDLNYSNILLNKKQIKINAQGYSYNNSFTAVPNAHQYSNKIKTKNAIKQVINTKNASNIYYNRDNNRESNLNKEISNEGNKEMIRKNWKKQKLNIKKQQLQHNIKDNIQPTDIQVKKTTNQQMQIETETLLNEINLGQNIQKQRLVNKLIYNQGQQVINCELLNNAGKQQKQLPYKQKQNEVKVKQKEWTVIRQSNNLSQSNSNQNQYNPQYTGHIQNGERQPNCMFSQVAHQLNFHQNHELNHHQQAVSRFQQFNKVQNTVECQQNKQQDEEVKELKMDILQQMMEQIKQQLSNLYENDGNHNVHENVSNDNLNENFPYDNLQENVVNEQSNLYEQQGIVKHDQNRAAIHQIENMYLNLNELHINDKSSLDQLQIKHQLQQIIKHKYFSSRSANSVQLHKQNQHSMNKNNNNEDNYFQFNLDDVLNDVSYIKDQDDKKEDIIFQPQFNQDLFVENDSFGKERGKMDDEEWSEENVIQKNIKLNAAKNGFRGQFRGDIKAHFNPKKEALRKFKYQKNNSAYQSQNSLMSMRNNSLSIVRDSSTMSGKSKKNRKSNLIRFNTRLNKNI